MNDRSSHRRTNEGLGHSVEIWVAVYEEIGRNYRFFLNWRYAAFLGNFLMLGTVFSLALDESKAGPFSHVLCLAGALTSLVFLLLDMRTSELFRSAYRSATQLEQLCPGFYSDVAKGLTVSRRDPKRKAALTHTKIIRFVYVLSSVILLSLWYIGA